MRGPGLDGEPLLIRADASMQIGTGHVMRCLALAQAWQEAGGTAHFVLAEARPALEERLASEGMGITHLATPPGGAADAVQTVALAQQEAARWVVVDGYQFDTAYQQAIKAAGLRLLFVDDYGHAAHYYADLVLNQNIYADGSLYPNREPYTRLLLGTAYVLLRREFWPWRGWRRKIQPMARKLLVTMGGSDPDNVTLMVLQALQQVPVRDIEVKVVIGSSNPHQEILQETLRTSQGLSVWDLIENTCLMPDLMAWADVAVSAGGSTCWELAFMQLPSVLLALAENQRPNAAGLAAADAAVNLGSHKDVSLGQLARAMKELVTSKELRARMALQSASLVDAQGGNRVAELLANVPVRVRPVLKKEQGLLFQWANDPVTRQMSFHSESIPWEEHKLWFDRATSDENVSLLIAEYWERGRWIAIGQVRIDADGVVSISLSPNYRGRRLAQSALKAAIAYHDARNPGRMLTAYVKTENQPSQRIFLQTGFLCMGQTRVLGQPCLRYVYRSSNLSRSATE